MEMTLDKRQFDAKMIQLGFRDITSGTAMLRRAVELYQPGMYMTKELYPAIAKEIGSTPSRVERCMRHAIETAFDRANPFTVGEVFGYSIDPNRGAPTVSEFVARMKVFCCNEQ